MDETPDKISPGQWKAGAKALAAFQAEHFGVAKGGKVDGGPRKGSKYATLTDILEIANKGSEFGLSHSGQPRMIGSELLVWRHCLHHESGEMIYAEWPISIPTSGQAGQRQQEQGGGATYARKYCIQGLFGIHADDGMDPDSNSYEDSKPTKAPSKAPAKKPAPVATPVVVSEPQQPAPNADGLSADEHALCLAIIKDPDKGDDAKKQFMAKFYPSVVKLTTPMINHKDHLAFLDAVHTGIPF